jgi:hypothetical protein
MGWYGLDWLGSGQGPVEGSCEHGNEPSGSIKFWEVLEWLSFAFIILLLFILYRGLKLTTHTQLVPR